MEKTINEKILDVLHNAVVSEGGDGSALWLSKFGKLEDLINVVSKYNYENNIGWYVKLSELHILWYMNQECIIITNSGEYFMTQNPEFYDLILEY